MEFNIHWVSNKYIEFNVDDVNSGGLDAKQARELAKDLIEVVRELLQVED